MGCNDQLCMLYYVGNAETCCFGWNCANKAKFTGLSLELPKRTAKSPHRSLLQRHIIINSMEFIDLTMDSEIYGRD